MKSVASQRLLFDYDYRGQFDLNGNLKKVYNRDAVINGLAMWFSSLSGEMVRLPAWGGWLTDLIFKPMKEEDAQLYSALILDGFEQNFRPYAKVSNLSLTPNFAERMWEIDMFVYVPEYDYSFSFSGQLENRS